MAGFSVSQAIGSGFRLIRREPSAILVWWLAYLVFAVLMYGVIWLSAPEVLGEYVALGRGGATASPEQLSAITGSLSKLTVFAPLLLVVGLAYMAVFAGAIYRAVLEPEARRMAYLRFGRQELWLLLSMIVWGLLSLLVYVGIIFVAALSGGLLGAGLAAAGGGQAAVMVSTVVCMLAAIVLTLWVMMRLGLALPMSFTESRFVVFEGWRAAKGQGTKVLLVALGVLGLAFVLEVAILAVFFVASSLLGPDPAAFTQPAQLGRLAPLMIVWTLFSSVLGVAFYVILTAPLADIYRQLKGEDVSVFS